MTHVFFCIDIISIKNTIGAKGNPFLFLNNTFNKNINGKRNCFLSDIKRTKSPDFQQDNVKIWTGWLDNKVPSEK